MVASILIGSFALVHRPACDPVAGFDFSGVLDVTIASAKVQSQEPLVAVFAVSKKAAAAVTWIEFGADKSRWLTARYYRVGSGGSIASRPSLNVEQIGAHRDGLHQFAGIPKGGAWVAVVPPPAEALSPGNYVVKLTTSGIASGPAISKSTNGGERFEQTTTARFEVVGPTTALDLSNRCVRMVTARKLETREQVEFLSEIPILQATEGWMALCRTRNGADIALAAEAIVLAKQNGYRNLLGEWCERTLVAHPRVIREIKKIVASNGAYMEWYGVDWFAYDKSAQPPPKSPSR